MRKKILFFCVITVASIACLAQPIVEFHVTPDGSFKSPEGKDYIVVPFEGKNAHQIYVELATNVGSIYNSPANVMSSVEDVSIKIRAIKNFLVTWGAISSEFSGYYQLEFKIKDGRVRITAPIIEQDMTDKNGYNHAGYYRKYIKGIFKDGVAKGKQLAKYIALNQSMNSTINAILGLCKSEEEEDW